MMVMAWRKINQLSGLRWEPLIGTNRGVGWESSTDGGVDQFDSILSRTTDATTALTM